MSQASSAAQSGNVIIGTDEASRPTNWPLVISLALAGIVAAIWLFKRK